MGNRMVGYKYQMAAQKSGICRNYFISKWETESLANE